MTFKRRPNYGTNSLFFRMLFYFLTLLVPVIIIGLLSYAYSIKNLNRDLSNMVNMHLRSAIKTVDIYIQTSQEINLNFLYDESVRKQLVSPGKMSPSQKIGFDGVLKTISRNQNVVNYFIDNLFIYQDNENVFRSDGIDDFSTFFNNLYRFEKYDFAFWENNLRKVKTIEILPPSNVYEFDGTTKNVIPIITVNKMNTNNTAMVICLSTDTIFYTVKNNSPFEGTEFIILDKDNHWIVGSGDRYRDDMAAEKLRSQLSGWENPSGELTLDNRRMILNFHKSENFGWKYYALTPVSEFNVYARDILKMTFISCISLIIIGIGLAFLFSFKLYNPIKNIRDILLETRKTDAQKSLESSKDVLDVIRNDICSLVNNNTDTLNKFQKVSRGYLDNTLAQLIFGRRIEHGDLFEWMLQDVVKFSGKHYLCCNILIWYQDSFYSDIPDTDRLNISDGIKKIIWAFFEEKFRTYVLEVNHNIYSCIINTENIMDREILHETINHLMECFQYDWNYMDIVVGIGSSCQGVYNISKSHSDAMSAIGTRKPGLKFQIIDSEALSIRYNTDYSFNDEIKLLNCLKTNDITNLKKILKEIFMKNRENTLAYKNMNGLFEQLYNTGIRFVVEYGYSSSSVSGSDEEYIFSRDSNFPISLDKKYESLESFFERVIKVTAAKSESRSNSLISMITDYIEKNYDKDIYLEKIALEMGISTKYISRAFKIKTGINLSDFISQVRVKKAKDLLLNTWLNIDEISRQVGISNRFTFLRIFKKVEGISPTSFRSTPKVADAPDDYSK